MRAVGAGHLLFASLGTHVVAVPLLRTKTRDDESVLWRETLLPIPSDVNNAIVRPSGRSLALPFDSVKEESILVDSGNKQLASTGPMSHVGACFQKIRTFTCVDPLTGKSLWTHQNLEQGQELFGDEHRIYAVPQPERQANERQVSGRKNEARAVEEPTPEVRQASVYDAVDGRSLGKRRLPRHDRWWTICGRNILAWEPVNTGFRLYLFDVEMQQDVWSEELAAGTKGCLVENDGVAVLQPDGKFFLRSLVEDKKLVAAELPPVSHLDSVRVRSSLNQWLVIVNDAPSTLPVTNNSPFTSVNGSIYSFSRQDGSPTWQSPAVVRGYGIVAEQPDDLPTLWLVRPFKQGQSSPSQNGKTDVLCLDRRTGAVLLKKEDVASPAVQLQVLADSKKRDITFLMTQAILTIHFTDEPRPPEPPAQLAQAESGFGAGLKKEFDEIVNSFSKSLKPQSSSTAAEAKNGK
jgi:hypothetical protein